jgi:diguanylate cyclase (GGDEF)-like protein
LPLAPFLTDVAWFWISSLTIAGLNLFGVWLVLRGRRIAHLRVRPLLAAAFLAHAVVYSSRLVILLAIDGEGALRHTLAVATMFEGVLYAVAVPALFIAAIREEREHQLVAASRTDFLTGLDNRRALAQKVRALAPQTPHALLLADLDHFKRVNDSFGHEVGDEVLKLFARVAAAELPPGAIIARLGGEEFAAILPGTPDGTVETARRLAARFTEATRRLAALDAGLTVSIGLAALPAGADGLAGALRAADRALYRAKAGGRDRVEIDAQATLPDLPRRISSAAPRRARTPWSTRAAG